MQSYFDVTVRCPHAVRTDNSGGSAASRPAQAALDGEQEKAARYGLRVQPVALETYGRVGPRSMESLKQATMYLSSLKRGTRGSAVSLYGELRLDLERCLIQEIADTTLRSLGHGCALHAWRRRQASGVDAGAGARRRQGRGGGCGQ